MNCSCGGNTEHTHKVRRQNEIQGEYQKCPVCGRVNWLWISDKLQIEVGDKEVSNFKNRGEL